MTKINELKPKVSIIGCGNVGMRYAYALIMKGLARSIVITDIDKKRLEGEVMDLSHGAPYVSPVEIIAGDYCDIKGSDLVVITAGKKQKPGQTRIALAKDNVEVCRQIVSQIMKYAPSAIFLVSTNPVDILSYATYKFSSKPANEVIGSGTVLDTARFRFLLGQHCKIDPHSVHAYILGEHGNSESAIWSHTTIGGVLFKNYCSSCGNKHSRHPEEELKKIFSEVRDSAGKIIEKKGETSYGIGLSLARITQAILHDENAVLPISSLVTNYLDMRDVYLSLPAVIGKKGIREVLKLDFTKEEEAALKKSASALREVIKEVGL
ncbi:MAG: L-lactate dehydrogenase [Candidatus Omnitrophota bacterium]|nr:L-lactate dehydrogenase [Candidatus Omnitrophota bacterium]